MGMNHINCQTVAILNLNGLSLNFVLFPLRRDLFFPIVDISVWRTAKGHNKPG